LEEFRVAGCELDGAFHSEQHNSGCSPNTSHCLSESCCAMTGFTIGRL
jgi:hypothetical protein